MKEIFIFLRDIFILFSALGIQVVFTYLIAEVVKVSDQPYGVQIAIAIFVICASFSVLLVSYIRLNQIFEVKEEHSKQRPHRRKV